MWIMLNNRPLDISKIEGISEVITLDSKYFVEQKEKAGAPLISLRLICMN